MWHKTRSGNVVCDILQCFTYKVGGFLGRLKCDTELGRGMLKHKIAISIVQLLSTFKTLKTLKDYRNLKPN